MVDTERNQGQTIWLIVILLTFGVLGVVYSVVTPIFEASDELWHYPVVQYIAAGHGLPVQTLPDRPGLWKQEASQPPLYYALAGWLTAWIDTSDLTAVLRPNPHAAIGVVAPDGNINMVAHDPAREAWPWRGTVLAVHLTRLLSVAMGTVTVYLTYSLGRQVFPHRPEIALVAAALNAFTPMFIFISGSVNNDNLVIPLCALALWVMIKQVARDGQEPGNWRGWVGLGIIIGLATLSKVNALALLVPAALTGIVAAWRRGPTASSNRLQSALGIDGRYLFVTGLAIGCPVLAISGWWFWRNIRLYGDPLGFSLFTPYFTRPVPADLAQIWSERTSFLYGYWGNFGGLNLPIPQWACILLNSLLLIAAAGMVYRLWLIAYRLLRGRMRHGQYAIRDTWYAPFPLFLIALWGWLIFVLWLRWTQTTWSSQGRLVFAAIPSYSILLAAGLAVWLPRRSAPYILGMLVAGMAVLAAAMPFTVIAPAYARPLQLTETQYASISYRTDVTFGHSLKLLGYDTHPPSLLKPGDSMDITLYWQSLQPMERDYSLFVHLLDENDIEVQDKGPAYPGRGNLPTTTLLPGQTWAETWVVPIRPAAYAPSTLTWEIGVYEAATAQRLPAIDAAGRVLGDNIRFGSVTLSRAGGSLPNPIAYNFDDQIELVGFDLDRRVVRPGETLTLTLFWRARSAPVRDYTVFAHVLQPPQTLWAGFDKQPVPPTSLWKPGQVVSDAYSLTLKPETPPAVYAIEVGVYFFTDASNLERLKLLTRDGRLQQDFVLLSNIRVTR